MKSLYSYLTLWFPFPLQIGCINESFHSFGNFLSCDRIKQFHQNFTFSITSNHHLQCLSQYTITLCCLVIFHSQNKFGHLLYFESSSYSPLLPGIGVQFLEEEEEFSLFYSNNTSFGCPHTLLCQYLELFAWHKVEEYVELHLHFPQFHGRTW